jgi:hypothetical protein
MQLKNVKKTIPDKKRNTKKDATKIISIIPIEKKRKGQIVSALRYLSITFVRALLY